MRIFDCFEATHFQGSTSLQISHSEIHDQNWNDSVIPLLCAIRMSDGDRRLIRCRIEHAAMKGATQPRAHWGCSRSPTEPSVHSFIVPISEDFAASKLKTVRIIASFYRTMCPHVLQVSKNHGRGICSGILIDSHIRHRRNPLTKSFVVDWAPVHRPRFSLLG